MSDDERFRDAIERMGDDAGPILGAQRARLGAERFGAFVEGHGKLQAMALFLVMSVATVSSTNYADDALDAIRQDARDVRAAADEWAKLCEDLADRWQAQREEAEP